MPTNFIVFSLTLLTLSNAFYLPGIAMHEYAPGESIAVYANKLVSPSNALPYAYYTLPFCRPNGPLKSRPVNLGQLLAGERAFPTLYDLKMMKPQTCQSLCTVDLRTIGDKPYRKLVKRIEEGYSARLNADNMPLVTRYITRGGEKSFRFGHAVGFVSDGNVYVNNHLRLTVRYHQPSLSSGEALDVMAAEADKFRIVGFEVEAFSVQHKVNAEGQTTEESCGNVEKTDYQLVSKDGKITFTYGVNFVASDLAWATRWDPILDTNAEIKKVQWFSIVNSLMVSLFLTALVATVMLRTVLRDFGRYNALDEEEDDDMTGWKYVHADVFRPPSNPAVLSVCVGCGSQVLVMALLTQMFALIGFLSPANRGALLTVLLSLWVLSSAVSGYVTARLYATIGMQNLPRRIITFATALVFPGITFGIFFALNLVMWMKGSSGGVPFTTMLVLLFMWFGMSVPLVFFGSYLGYRRKPYDFPTRTNQIHRQIPPLPLGLKPMHYALIAGVLPFGTVFMELVVILNSVWTGSVYYLYGALLSVFLILVVTCAEMSIVSTYLSLSAEDWKSHWNTSFWGCGSSGLYIFLYSLYFSWAQSNPVQIPFVSKLVFISWSLVVSGAFALMCGTVGFFASFWFTRKIYSSIRID